MGIVIVDYGMGNLRSVQKAFEICGAKAKVSSDRLEIARADKIVLPGVGAFGEAMRELKKRGLVPVLKSKIIAGTPYLGLCLGLQLLFDRSEEGHTPGLGIIAGQVRRFKGAYKIPHMGWNTIRSKTRTCAILKGLKKGEYFYFVHSYFAEPKDKSWVAATTTYGGKAFCSAIAKDHIFATQFHPEKSQTSGLKVIRNFIQVGGKTK